MLQMAAFGRVEFKIELRELDPTFLLDTHALLCARSTSNLCGL